MGVWMCRPGLAVRTGGTVSVLSLLACAGVVGIGEIGLSVVHAAAASTALSAQATDEPKNEPSTEPGTPAQPASGSQPGTGKPPVNDPVIDVKKQAQKPRPGQVMPGDGGSANAAKPATAPTPQTAPTPPTLPAQASKPAQPSTQPTPPVQPNQPKVQTPATPPRQPVGEVPKLRPIVVNRSAGSGATSPATQPASAAVPTAEPSRAEPVKAAAEPKQPTETMKPIERITPEPIERPAPAKPELKVEPKVEVAKPAAVEPPARETNSEPTAKVVTSGEPELPRMQPIEPAKPVEPTKPVEPAKPAEIAKPVEPAKVVEMKAVEPSAPVVPTAPTPAPSAPAPSGGDSPLQRLRESVVVSPASLTVESQAGLVQWRSVDANADGEEGWAALSVGQTIAGQIEVRTGPLSEVSLRSNEGELLTVRRLSRVRVYRLQAPSDESGVRAASRLTAELSRGRMTATPAPAVISTEKNAGVRSAIPSRRNAVSVLVDGSLVLAREATEISLDARGLSVRNVESDTPATNGK